ncbi:ribulose-phosphate 3-epimerase, partial [Aerococcus urinae]|nr:ribulose-phosphate 3-epimerase [Aerococcus urinae]
MDVKISPSILNCDFGHLADELEKISNADFVHVDIMDN